MKFLRLQPGSKSVLFGVHQFAIHPFVVALGWHRAFGFARVRIGTHTAHYAVPSFTVVKTAGDATIELTRGVFTSLFDPRLWLAFLVHDIGLFGKPDMDGPIGETHPEVGARLMRRLFGDIWGDLVLLHSRYYAKRLDRPVSALCIADKWAIVVEPSWLYMPRAWASGELREYLAVAKRRTSDPAGLTSEEYEAFVSGNPWRWHRAVKSYMCRWLAEHGEGKADSWTRVRHGAKAEISL